MSPHLLSGSRAGRQLLQAPPEPAVFLEAPARTPEMSKAVAVGTTVGLLISAVVYGFAGYGVYKFATRNR